MSRAGGVVDREVRVFGDCALIVTADGPGASARLAASVRSEELSGVSDVVAGLASVVVRFDPSATETAVVVERLRSIVPADRETAPAQTHRVPTVFDGEDLDEVSRTLSLSAADVVAQLTGARLRVALLGFSPGFAYLDGLPPPLDTLARRPSPRPVVPAGSVALAGGFAAVYPQATPGGWNLVGRTETVMFDPIHAPYATLAPGDVVRFVDVGPGARARQNQGPDAPGRLTGPAGWSDPVAFLVEEPGLLTLVQDRGRPGLAHLGVPEAAPADPVSHQLANRLVGNRPGAAALEITARGPTLVARSNLHVALVGAVPPVTLDDHGVDAGRVVPVTAGQRLSVGDLKGGLRTYLAVAGGLTARTVMASTATDTLSWTGPGPLRRGDELGLAPPDGTGTLADHLDPTWSVVDDRRGDPAVVRVLVGPHPGCFEADALDTLVRSVFEVTGDSDRVGLRLRALGGVAIGRRAEEIASQGMVLGAVQVPPDGQPVVLGPDHATLGGYPVVAVVIRADHGVLGQSRPGDRIRFVSVTMAQARRAARSLDRAVTNAVVGHYPTMPG